jgi:hypothetical protein
MKLQARSARDFVPNQGLKFAGVLCVFQDFQTDQLGQKTRRAPLPIDSEVPMIFKPISWGKRPTERRSRLIQRFP